MTTPRPRVSTKQTPNDLLETIQSICADVPHRRLYLCTGIDEAIIHQLITALDLMDRDDGEITLTLNSAGGSAYDALALYDALKLARNDIKIIGLGAVMSAATLILQAGDVRLLAPNTRFMIHNGSWNLGDAHASVIVSAGKEMEYSNRRYAEILASKAKIDAEAIENLCLKETFLSAQEAVAKGFADDIYTTAWYK
jgi:ATP-dependent Clp endopeptidase proteolytic subunit ClpP